MKRRIIHIDEEKCNGCGACAAACHEGAIAMVNGKAKLMRDDYCDGLGDCLPACPTGAITFVEREAAAYNAEAVKENMMKKRGGGHHGGCPGSRLMTMNREENAPSAQPAERQSRLRQWPVQIKLVPVNAPYFDKAAHRRRLHRLRLCGVPRKIHQKPHNPCRLPEARQRRLFREADGDNREQQYTVRDGRQNGSPLLRRTRTRRKNSIAEQRQIHPVAGRDDIDRRAHPRLSG